MRPDHEIVVVGAGIVGLATAHALAGEGRDVLALEQFQVGHRRGSSHGATRVFRLAYPDPDWVRLAQRALLGWRDLEAETGEELLSLVGLVELVRGLDDSSRDALQACGVDCEALDSAELRHRFSLSVPTGFAGLLQPEAGILYAERALRAFADRVRVEEEVEVTGLQPGEKEVRVETSAGSLLAATVVVAAGAWARPLLERNRIALDVVPTRETVAYFPLASGQPPPAVAELRAGTSRHAFYALHDPEYGLKAGLNASGPPTDPDAEGKPDPDIVRQIAEWTRARFGLEAAEPTHTETCLYTNTRDERFVLERHGRLVIGSACSGHGFKFAPVVGRQLADLVLETLA